MSCLKEDLKWRYATKKFDKDKKVSKEDLDELLDSLVYSPSSFGLEPWKFLVITDSDLREKLKSASWNQAQITDASHLIVLCARKDVDKEFIKRFIKLSSEVRNLPMEKLKDYEEMILGFRSGVSDAFIGEWNKKQVYITLGFLLSAAARLRIDSCPMEGFDSEKYDELLDLKKSNYTATLVCPVGYRSGEDSYKDLEKVRYPKEEIIDFIK